MKYAVNPLWMGFLIFLTLSACSSPQISHADQVCFKDHCVNVEIVQKEQDLMRGLQLRKSLDEKAGMLFVFPDSAQHSFWMKDTLISLDMIWLDYARRVVYVAYNVPPCEKDPCPTYTPPQDALYVLEVNAGWAPRFNVQIGDETEFKLDNSLSQE